ncbi:MAG: hypothetical protein ACOX0E_06520 [Syntrophomonadaceae bacterium]|jgi:hypothetical protein
MYLIIIIGAIAGFIIILVTFWRFMKAHESLAESLSRMEGDLKKLLAISEQSKEIQNNNKKED